MTLGRVVFALAVLLTGWNSTRAEDKKPAEIKVSYQKQILPLLQAKCMGCHQPAKKLGGYDMTDFEKMVLGGDSELTAVVPNKPGESRLIDLITPDKKGKAAMPRGAKALLSAERELITKWISQGAHNDLPKTTRKFDAAKPPVYTRAPVVTSLDYSPDGSLIAVAGYHEVLLHKSDGSGIVGRLVGLSERIESVRFSPKGDLLAVVGGNPARFGEIQIWDVKTKKLKLSKLITFDTVYGANWSKNGKLLSFGCADNTVRAIEIPSGKQAFFNRSHEDWVLSTTFTQSGEHLVSVGRDRTAKLYVVKTDRFIDNITSITPGALKGGISTVQLHPKRDNLLIGGADGVPKIYRIFRITARKIGDDSNLVRRLPAMTGRVFDGDWSNDGKQVVAVSSLDGKGMLRIYAANYNDNMPADIKKIVSKTSRQQNSAEKKRLDDYLFGGIKTIHTLNVPGGLYAVRWKPDGTQIATAGGDGSVRLIDPKTGKILKAFLSVPKVTGEKKVVAKKALARPQEEIIPVALGDESKITALEVDPPFVSLKGSFDYTQLLVTGLTSTGDRIDLTRHVKVTAPAVVNVSPNGLVVPVKTGTGKLTIALGKQSIEVPFEATVKAGTKVDFIRHVNPVLSKLGCNAGTCHGSKDGKAGFKLSLRGYDPIFDVRSFTDELAARRTNIASPADSLMLLKSTAAAPHTGGQLTRPGEAYYETIRRWIAQGAKLDLSVPRVKAITITPSNPVVQKIGSRQQVRVIATYSDGSKKDVTQEAFVTSGNGDIADEVGPGLIATKRRGEAPLLARYEGAYAATTLTVMGDRGGFIWKDPGANNAIDKLVAKKLFRMKILASDLCSDAEFIRRVYLDITGLPPSAEVVQKFLADKRPTKTKRDELIDKLVGNTEFVDYWTNKWADLLQVNRKFLGPEGAKSFRDWIRKQVEQNTPYDKFAYQILTASGSNKTNPAASYYKILRDPTATMENTTHLFLAIRFNCNKCHDHPFERWTQDQYYETSAFFARTGLKADPASGKRRIGGTAVEGAKPYYEIVYDKPNGEVKHDRTGAVTPPQFPFKASFSIPKKQLSRRERFARWMTSAKNPYFAKSYVNRIWGYLLGVGLIEPLDDIRAGNPPSNPELLDWLTSEFIKSKFDTRALIKTICKSRAYQRSIRTNIWNVDDKTNYSHAIARRLPAEVLFDAIHAATGSKSRIPGVPVGTRAVQIPDAGIKLPSGFLAKTGRPPRESACECERTAELQLGPVMALVGGPVVGNAIADPANAINKLANDIKDDRALVKALFLRILNVEANERQITASLKLLNGLDDDHKLLVQSLADYRAKLSAETLAAEKARKQQIVKAKAAIDAYLKKHAERFAKMEADRKTRIAQAQKTLADYDRNLAPRIEAWSKAQETQPGWRPLKFQSAKSTFGAKLTQEKDLAIFVTGRNAKGNYQLSSKGNAGRVTGFRIEALADKRLPAKGPGRPRNGNFVLSELIAEAWLDSAPNKKIKLQFADAKASFSQGSYNVKTAIDGRVQATNNGWAIAPQLGRNQTAVFSLRKPLEMKGPFTIAIRIVHQFSDGKHSLGRFRISVTADAGPLRFGLPANIKSVLAKAPEKRNAAEKKRLADYYKSNDPKRIGLAKAVAEASKPLPADAELTKLRRLLASAESPLPRDPQLARLERAVGLSETQLKTRRQTAAQDITWALINSPAFLFNR